MKKMRMIAISILLFQNCLFTATAFAEERSVEIDTELVQDLQEQKEIPATENIPMVEAAESEPEQTVSDEPSGSEDLNQLQPEPDTGSESANSVDSAAVPESTEVSETNETNQTNQTQEPVLVEENKEEVGTPSETPTEEVHNKMMALPSFMRMSAYSLPNLNQYRPYLTSNGESSYIQRVMQSATNRSVTLGAEVGATASFTTSFSTNSMVQGDGSDWIAYISSDKALPEAYFTQMYYGNHSSFNNTYSLNNLRGSGVPSYIQVTPTVTSISNYRVTLSVTIRRTATTTNNSDQFNLLGNLTLGTTAVAPVVNNYSKNIENVNYQNAVIGNITVNNEQPSATIKNSVIVEATRNNLSQDTIKSWFSALPSNVNDYTFSVSGPSSWAPGLKGTATVTMRHNSSGASNTFTTQYEVRDTQAPTGTVKNEVIDVEARRSGNLSQEELRQFVQTSSDNWTSSDNLKFHLVNANGEAATVAGLAPGNTYDSSYYLQLRDIAGNYSSPMLIKLRIVDTQAPTGTVKDEVIDVEARRTGNLSQEELRQFVQTSGDNWTLSENIKLNLVGLNGGSASVANISPGTTYVSTYFLQMEDEAGNKSSRMAIKLRIVDTQAPTGTVKNEVIDVEARRSGNLSQSELRQFVQTSSDNWTLSENIKLNLVSQQGTSISVAGLIPGASFLNTYYLQLEDEAGNKSTPMLIKLRIIDTQAPTGTVKDEVIDVEARRTGNLSQEELRQFVQTSSDNWTLSENIKLNLVGLNGGSASVANISPGNTYVSTYFLQMEDEAGNKSSRMAIKLRIVDTQAPTGTVKTSGVEIEARRTGSWMRTDLLKFIDGDLEDNWSMADDIRFEIINNEGIFDIEGKAPGSYGAYVDLYDEAGNMLGGQYANFKVVDTQAPTGILSTTIPNFEYRTQGDWTREELLTFFDGRLSDNWSDHEAITLGMDRSINQFPPSTGVQQATLTLTDEAGNKQQYSVRFYLTTFAIQPNVVIQAQRAPSLPTKTILSWFDGLSELVEDYYEFSMPDSAGGWAPGKTGQAEVTIRNKGTNRIQQQTTNYTVVDTEAPEGVIKKDRLIMEADRTRNFTQDELRLFFDELSDNWSFLENINLKSSNRLSSLGPNTGNYHYVLHINATDEEGNSGDFASALVRIEDTLPPTATVNGEMIDIEARRTGGLEREDLLRLVKDDLSDNWSLPDQIAMKVIVPQGNSYVEANINQAPGTVITGYLQLIDEAGNQTIPGPANQVSLRITDTQAPEFTTTRGTALEARREGDLSQEELRKLVDTMSDNWSLPEHLNISLVDGEGNPSNIHGIAPGDGSIHTQKYLQLSDETGNKTVPQEVWVYTVDTTPPVAVMKNETIKIEAQRDWTMTREELMMFIESITDNWDILDDIELELVNSNGNRETIGGRAPGQIFHAYLRLSDRKGNQSIYPIAMELVDTQGPQGTLKNDLSFNRGSTEPDARDYLDGEPTDNWTKPEDIAVSVIYENGARFEELKVGTHGFVLTLIDLHGNKTELQGQLTIKDNKKQYVDVTIPVRLSFAESKESGGIVSPTYQIQNNSEHDLAVSVASMTSKDQTEKLTDMNLSMSNNYNDTTISLIKDGKNLSQETEWLTLPKKTSSFAFSLQGTVGKNFDFDSLADPLRPQYSLQFHFGVY